MLFVAGLLGACGGGGGSSSSNSSPATPIAQPDPVPNLSAVTPQQLDYALNQGESAAQTISFTNSGEAQLTFELGSLPAWLQVTPLSGSVAAGASSQLSVTVTCDAVNLSGAVALTTNDTTQGDANIAVSAVCTPLSSNFDINKVTLNQAARGFDSSVSDTLSVPVLAGREMLVRAFVTGSNPVPPAQVVVSPPGAAAQVYPMQVPAAISATAGADSLLDGSHYVVLPGAALQSGATLRVEVGAGSSVEQYPQNTDLDLEVVDPGDLRVTFVPVTFGGQTPTIDVVAYMRESLQVLPIGTYDVEVRAPYVFNGSYDLDRLLTEMANLRDLDNSSRLYHGVIIPPGGSTSGTAGIGFVGFPVSVSIDLGGAFFIVAHELGHNLNLSHAPGCSSPNPDPQYPLANGAIGSWGYDIHNNSLVSPEGTKRDFMTYCNDLWVSDYHFRRAINHRDQSAIGFGPSKGAGLTISGRLEASGGISKLRMMQTDTVMPPVAHMAEDARDYEFVAWDANGIEVIRTTFAGLAIPDLGERVGFVFNVPAPLTAVDHYELRHAGSVVDAGSLAASPQAQVVEVAWEGESAQLTWQPRTGEVLVVRDQQGRVVTMDDTGSSALEVPGAQLQVSLVRGGRASKSLSSRRAALHSQSAGRDVRVEQLQFVPD